MSKYEVNESLLVGVSFSNDDTGVLIVGRQNKGKVNIVNAFQDREALELYWKLIGAKEKEDE